MPILFVLLTVFVFNAEITSQQAGKGPMKVFILAGQSNMEGHGYAEEADWIQFDQPNGSLPYLLKNPKTRNGFKHLVDRKGKHVVRKDVWVYYNRGDKQVAKGDLTIGFGAHDPARAFTIGPELGFGWVMGDLFEDQVLLIKTAWGGKSLAVDFRPPSSGGETGPFYTKMITQVKEVLGNLKKQFPEYNGKGYEIVGFGWHQGWNDYCNESFIEEYEQNLANLIRDVRKELGVKNLPFVVAETGMANPDKNAKAQKLCTAQGAVAEYDEFKGTVGNVKTRKYYSPENSPWKKYGYHWHGSFYSYYLVGCGMGESMKGLLEKETEPVKKK